VRPTAGSDDFRSDGRALVEPFDIGGFMFRISCRVPIALVLAAACYAQASAQTSPSLTGRLYNSLSGDPVGGLTVTVDELKREAQAAADGTFRFDNVPPGSYHLSIRGEGFTARRTEVTVSTTAAMADIGVDPIVHYSEVLSVSPEPRALIESYQPTTVLAGQELTKQLEVSLGDTLEYQPGVAARSFGPAPARPVIRGLDGDRVLILQDGQRMGDLSSQSGDHGVQVNPAAAQRIEVVRGPATLLYGANAIGGLVNVITDQVPTRPVTGTRGNFTIDAGTGAFDVGGAGELLLGNGRVALQLGGGGRRSGDVSTPDGDIENSQSRNGFGTVGLSWTGGRGFVGGSYGYDDTKYGIPVIEEGAIQLTPRRHSLDLRGGAQGFTGFFESFRANLANRQYTHDELEGDLVATTFTNDTTEVDGLASHRLVGRLKGSAGAAFSTRAFDAVGAEALSPAVDQQSGSAFLFEELTWPHVTFQFGGRVEHTGFEPVGEPTRDFTNFSGSVGLLLRPAAANEALTIAVSLARAARNPALEELFFFGPHHGNFAFEIGNPDLESEKAFGVDLSLRWSLPRASGEVTYFRNDITDFIFRQELTEEEFEAREPIYGERFPNREIDHEDHGHGEDEAELPFVEYVGADSLLQGIEAHTDLQITGAVMAELGVDYVRGSLKASGDPLPRMPPFRVRLGLRYQRNAFQAGGEVITAAEQDRVLGSETPTDGYALLKLFGSYSVQTGKAVSTITARLDNATNALYRNHLSLIKDFVPEMGRSFKVLYNVRF
jgi:iron complex outermembrane receptor protein